MDNKNQTTTLKIKTTSTKTAITIITNTAIMKTIKRTIKRNLKKLGKPMRTTIPKKKLTMVTRMRQLTQLTRLTSMKTIKKTRK
jgi:vacuolar-type H+-ATPase subunit F/Vma7